MGQVKVSTKPSAVPAARYRQRMAPRRTILFPFLVVVLLGVASCTDGVAEAQALAAQACSFREADINEGTPPGTAMRHLASVLSQAAHAAAEAAAKDDAYLELTEALTRAERSADALSALLDENDDDLTASGPQVAA